MVTKWKNYEFPFRLIAVLLAVVSAFSGGILAYTAGRNALLFDGTRNRTVYESEYFYALIRQEIGQLAEYAHFRNQAYLEDVDVRQQLYEQTRESLRLEQQTMEVRLDQMLWLQNNLPQGTDVTGFTSYLFVNCETPEEYAEAFRLCCPSLNTDSFLQMAKSNQPLPEVDLSQPLPESEEAETAVSVPLLSLGGALPEATTDFPVSGEWVFDAGDATGEVQNPSGYAVELKGYEDPATWLNYYYRIRVYLVERVGTPVLSENVYQYTESLLAKNDISSPWDTEPSPEEFTLPAADSIRYFYYYPATGEYLTNMESLRFEQTEGGMFFHENAQAYFETAKNEAKNAPWHLEITGEETFDSAQAARRNADTFRRELFGAFGVSEKDLTSDALGGELVMYSDLDNRQAGYADAYTLLAEQFGDAKAYQNLYVFFAVVCLLIFAAAALYILIAGSGRRLAIDRLYNDWHFLLSGGLLALTGWGTVVLFFIRWEENPLSAHRLPLFLLTALELLIPTAAALFLLVGLEYLASVIRCGKNGTLLRHSCWYAIGAKLTALARKQAEKRITGNPEFYKKQYKITLAAGIAYTVLTSLLPLAGYMPWLSVFVAAADLALLSLVLQHIKALDRITAAAASIREGDYSQPLDMKKIPRHLQALASDLLYSREGMRAAIEKSVRDERLKAELITNVSHDLKTPLTSIVTYSDLLKKQQLPDDTARGYVDIIDEKAHRLKQLIEDLTEASKASTGNVPLHRMPIDLYEMALQAIGENSDALQKENIEVRVSEPAEGTWIYADSRQTWRVIENLFSNVQKYAMPGTRVYVEVCEKDGRGVFTMKNISRAPLNIPAGELTQRFVRGDEARGGEGSGLGLSIAKSLCEMQNGSFSIEIDGDLFKASFSLPKAYRKTPAPDAEAEKAAPPPETDPPDAPSPAKVVPSDAPPEAAS